MNTRLTLITGLASACLLACGLGTIESTNGPSTGGVDAGPDLTDADPNQPDAHPAAPDAASIPPDAASGAPDSGPACDDPVSPVGDGFHKAGQPCMPCHDVAYGALPPFTLAGTLYNNAAGAATVPGATFHIVDDHGDEITLVTTNNGNFWATGPIAFPAQVRVSKCPDDAAMPNLVQASGLDCNTCHNAGNRIHLP